MFVATAVLGALVLWLESRVGAILLAAGIGGSMVFKPLLVPFEGAGSGDVFPYDSETAMTYWLPGAVFIVCAAALASTRRRLAEDLARLRPRAGTLVVAVMVSLAAYAYFSRPTLYDVYRRFRPQYQTLREHLQQIAPLLDRIARPSCASLSLEPPLVLDESSNVRNEDASTTGHILLYQHMTEPDAFSGNIEYAFGDDLHLHIRDTGNDPVLYDAGFGRFASEQNERSLEHTIGAPYLVVVKPLSLDPTERVDSANLEAAGRYRVFIYHLNRDQTLCAADVNVPVDELKEAVFAVLEQTAAARIIR